MNDDNGKDFDFGNNDTIKKTIKNQHKKVDTKLVSIIISKSILHSTKLTKTEEELLE